MICIKNENRRKANMENGKSLHIDVPDSALDSFTNMTTVATHTLGPVSEGVPNRLIVADKGCSLSHF